MTLPKTILIWHRHDLRVHDHEPLWQALQSGAGVIPVYCFDPRQFGKTAFGFPKTGTFRAKFLLESLTDLRRSYQDLGCNLVIRFGQPELILTELAIAYQATIYYYAEVTDEECRVERQLTQSLAARGLIGQAFWGQTLLHREDLPFGIAAIPELFTQFRKAVERDWQVRPCSTTPHQLPSLPVGLDPGEIPDLPALGLTYPLPDDRAALQFVGGETAGLARVQDYFWQGDRLRIYKDTRNGMKGADYSSKFSPWLALGCLSPRYLYWQVQDYEEQRVRNDSTYWLIFELLWRDYFRLIAAKHGNALFKVEGLQGVRICWRQDGDLFEAWSQGRTGFPLVDANMRELQATGFMSNRGRQNVASFLTKNLGIDWRMGAEWFESLLIDYDVCSNWGNWNYTAGVGNDARGFRFFNITKQAKDYDPYGEYVKHWLPELERIPAGKVHEPWKLLAVEQVRFGVKVGQDYPEAIVDLFQSATTNEKIYNAAFPRRQQSDKKRV